VLRKRKYTLTAQMCNRMRVNRLNRRVTLSAKRQKIYKCRMRGAR